MEFTAVSRVFFWIIILSAVCSLAFAEPSKIRPGPYRAECRLQLAVITSRPVSHWSPNDWSTFKNFTKRCDISQDMQKSKCSSTANLREQSQMKVGSSDCCELLDALKQRPESEWTLKEKQHYEQWNACCQQNMIFENYESIKQTSPIDCCKHLNALECRSADDWSLHDRRRYNGWVDCCLDNFQYIAGKSTSSFISLSLPRCCTAVKNLFSKSTDQFIALDEENIVPGKSRDCKPEDGCENGSNCCTPAVADEVSEVISKEKTNSSTCCLLLQVLWQEVDHEELSPADKASVMFWTKCCQGARNDQEVRGSSTRKNSSNYN